MSEIPNLSLILANRPENVAVVHEALIGVAHTLGLDALETDDVDTAVTEAVQNVVHHAYDGLEGPLEVELYVLADALEVAVRDRGLGIRPHVGERAQPHTGLGLPIVHALTERLVFTKLPDGGTEVRLCFAAPGLEPLDPAAAQPASPAFAQGGGSASCIELAFAPVALAQPVLSRLLGAVALRAGFSAEATADVRSLADLLAEGACDALVDGTLSVGVDTQPRHLELRLAPLQAGRGSELVGGPATPAGGLVARLSGDQRIASWNAAEMLVLRLSAEPRPAGGTLSAAG